MKTNLSGVRAVLCAAAIVCLCYVNTGVAGSDFRVVESFDLGWKFFKGEAKGAEQNTYDDLTWERIDVPHDWSIEGPFAKDNVSKAGGGYLPLGIGWYRKDLRLARSRRI